MADINYLDEERIKLWDEVNRLKDAINEISKITPEEIKLLNIFEAIVLIPRNHPIKTKLIPDYQIPWDLNDTKKEQPKRVNKEYKLFDIKKYI